MRKIHNLKPEERTAAVAAVAGELCEIDIHHSRNSEPTRVWTGKVLGSAHASTGGQADCLILQPIRVTDDGQTIPLTLGDHPLISFSLATVGEIRPLN